MLVSAFSLLLQDVHFYEAVIFCTTRIAQIWRSQDWNTVVRPRIWRRLEAIGWWLSWRLIVAVCDLQPWPPFRWKKNVSHSGFELNRPSSNRDVIFQAAWVIGDLEKGHGPRPHPACQAQIQRFYWLDIGLPTKITPCRTSSISVTWSLVIGSSLLLLSNLWEVQPDGPLPSASVDLQPDDHEEDDTWLDPSRRNFGW